MTIQERINKLKQDNYIVYHKALEDCKMEEWDWFRVRKNGYDFIFTEEVKNIDKVPEDLLQQDVIKEEVWMIGGILALDLFTN